MPLTSAHLSPLFNHERINLPKPDGGLLRAHKKEHEQPAPLVGCQLRLPLPNSRALLGRPVHPQHGHCTTSSVGLLSGHARSRKKKGFKPRERHFVRAQQKRPARSGASRANRCNRAGCQTDQEQVSSLHVRTMALRRRALPALRPRPKPPARGQQTKGKHARIQRPQAAGRTTNKTMEMPGKKEKKDTQKLRCACR